MLEVGERKKRSATMALVLSLVVLCAACDPGWVNPAVGTGDGSGQVPGSVAIAADQVALGRPTTMVDLGARGFLVYDQQNCTISLVDRGGVVRYGGNGVCGDSGDGGPATAASIDVNGPPFGSGLQLGSSSDVYFTTTSSAGSSVKIRRIDAATGTITTVPTQPDGGLILGVAPDPDGSVTYVTLVESAGPSKTWQLRRVLPDGSDVLVAETTRPGSPQGLFRVSDGHYVTSDVVYPGTERVDFVHGVVQVTNLSSAPNALDDTASIVCATGPDGSLYGFTYDPSEPAGGNRVFRSAPDGSMASIAGSGEPDPGTDRHMGTGGELALTAQGATFTHNGNLLIASGHVVYRLVDVVHAPAVSLPLVMGSPLNFFGGFNAAVVAP